VKFDEIGSVVRGMNFVLDHVIKPSFTFTEEEGKVNYEHKQDPYPHLLVNIGSGVSIIKIDGVDKFSRVSGTMLGGGTLVGLANLLIGTKNFDEIVELSKTGDNAKVDLLVKDIYGGDSPFANLQGDLLASSFGRVAISPENFDKNKLFEGNADFSKGDIAKSLLFMISFNIGHLAYLCAMLHNIKRIYFVGNFIRDHPFTMDKITFAVNYWSNSEMKAMFLKHDGYLGALGAFLYGMEIENKN